eukprot:COSAG01_NODE_87_length_27454_cov_201.243575_9_plen_84_part_00
MHCFLQLLRMCERYVKAYECTPHDDLRGESFLKPSTKMWARAILELILPLEAEGGGIQHRWGAGPMKKVCLLARYLACHTNCN